MKKFLVSLLAVAVVLSMAGVVLAADPHDPHNPTDDPTKPSVKPVTSGDVVVIEKPTTTTKSVDITVSSDKTEVADAINKLITGNNFIPSYVYVGGKSLDKIVTPATMFQMSAVSSDLASVDKMEIIVSMDATKVNAAFMQAHYDGTLLIDKTSYDLKAKSWYGDPVVTAEAISDDKAVKVTVNGPKYFFTTADVVLAKTTATSSGGDSSSGCNVGFAPMALLLGLPLFFLKK
ncbi:MULTISPECIES: Synerg-CTERM sorting domain-containing protein [Dethiosulfovibrio]|uniref:SYNERG-CTERM sorting domain-containing protein n=2 Tax=Dethiosulfovibrio TaxID=47054 RepID=A0ABS9ELV4_9BACT|nr:MULTISPECIES: Synerg-CTERM sorting domain-containing protein [Dethiosulfovibrio]MCF4113118.1 SYNERG-CTERM sorting domain-containing protein [Dethiosulfovibrio russensis]MCF4142182.1 SYNERG-CTERM sorting domain-containing protein [Dethiosulfovibrio marinus]MCF4145847.1 SYNERG-CTERM sorting domain-containing protein [Dethiosulfovibrio acidaminovorans]